jgi:hypothetical protein
MSFYTPTLPRFQSAQPLTAGGPVEGAVAKKYGGAIIALGVLLLIAVIVGAVMTVKALDNQKSTANAASRLAASETARGKELERLEQAQHSSAQDKRARIATETQYALARQQLIKQQEQQEVMRRRMASQTSAVRAAMHHNAAPVMHNNAAQMMRSPPAGVQPRMAYTDTAAIENNAVQRMASAAPSGVPLLTQAQAAALPAPMPAYSMSTPNKFDNNVDEDLGQLTTSNGGTYPGSVMGTGQAGTSATAFIDNVYAQDAQTMTPNTAGDMGGIQAFLPNDAEMTKDGKDPLTGLPVFTTNSLRRSNILGGHGAQGYLRPVQEPMTGSKRIGRFTKLTCDPREQLESMDKRRAQYNAARVESGQEDPVIFGMGEFAYK